VTTRNTSPAFSGHGRKCHFDENGFGRHDVVAGDLVVLENELAPVLQTFLAPDINRVAIHHRRTHEQSMSIDRWGGSVDSGRSV
jgi:hypothetical protein